MRKIAVLGSTGMLGVTLTKYLSSQLPEIVEINRSGTAIVSGNSALTLDILDQKDLQVFFKNERFDYLINATGLIKQKINEENPQDIELAYLVNSEFPGLLSDYSSKTSTPVIQIGTDCIFSGNVGEYSEAAIADCTDIYGKSKVEGESRSRNFMTLRTSIIGHEVNSAYSLMDWFLSLDRDIQVNGFLNHLWNGVTTLEFAKVVNGIIQNNDFMPGVTHLVPADQVSKYELLRYFAEFFARDDISIEPFVAEKSINRTLSTLFPERNKTLWGDASYNEHPTVRQMVASYSEWSPSGDFSM